MGKSAMLFHMSDNKVFELAVVGSGAAGSMGTLRGVLNGLETICFKGNAKSKKTARATWVDKVENMPVLFDQPKAVFRSSNEVFKWIKNHEIWKKFLTTVNDGVESVSGTQGNFKIHTAKGEVYTAKYVLFCTGIMDIQPEIKGDIAPIFPMANAGYLEYCIRCDGHKCIGKPTTVIGHTEGAGWVASLLYERYRVPEISILTNGKSLMVDADSELDKRLKCYGVNIFTQEIAEILGESNTTGLEGFMLDDGTVVTANIGFVSLGTIVHNQLAVAMGCNVDERGYVLTDAKGETSVPGIFVGGDLRANHKKQIYTAWDNTVDAVDRIDYCAREERRAAVFKNGCNLGVDERVGDLFGPS